ncbi:MAG: hypothetical protein NTU80_07915 [Verrucomicrobia bacterium]|nr:hypothetical protein [Verrucomicrobiota bacterium]
MSSPLYIVGAVVLWFFPLWAFRAPKSRLGGFDQRDWPTGRNLVFTVVDVLRASVGGWLMARGLVGLPNWPFGVAWMSEAWLALVLGLALTAQAFYWHTEDYLQAPVAFLIGALSAIVHPFVLILGLPLAVGAALAIRAWSACFVGASVGLIAIGMVVTAQDWRRTVLLGAAVNLPVLASMLAGRHLGGARK